MSIIYKNGNLFSGDHEAYAHGVNTKGVMGRGIAVDFKERYPEMFGVYEERSEDGSLTSGDVLHWRSEDKPDVFNLVTQDNLKQASPSALEDSIQEMYHSSSDHGIFDIGMPKIGTGYGNLPMNVFEDSLKPFRNSSFRHVTVYDFTTAET